MTAFVTFSARCGDRPPQNNSEGFVLFLQKDTIRFLDLFRRQRMGEQLPNLDELPLPMSIRREQAIQEIRPTL